MNFLGIDPGQSGGLAVLDYEGRPTLVVKMPITEGDLARLFDRIIASHSVSHCLIEKVGAFPDQGVVSSFTFGRGAGVLVGMLLAHRIPFEEIRPHDWQKLLGIPPRTKRPRKPKPFLEYPPEESKSEWKNRLRAKAQQLFPDVEVTLCVADALLIAECCRRMHQGFPAQHMPGQVLRRAEHAAVREASS